MKQSLITLLCALSLSFTGHAVANLGLLRRLALNLLRRDKTCKRGAKGKQLNAALKPDYLLRLLTATQTI